MKHILLITTGGTIACCETPDGLTPQITPEDLLSSITYDRSIYQIDCRQVLNLDSTNIEPSHWLILSEIIEKNYEDYDGFVICHGTDTMAYTAAALSYLIQNSRKPIILTGAQKPIHENDTDARVNLQDSILYAGFSRAHGISIVFGGLVIAGTRGRKMRSKSYQAFDSINHPEIARICDGRILLFIDDKDSLTGPVKFYHDLSQRVLLLKLIPGLDGELLYRLESMYDALIIESFGVGGLPDYGTTTFRDAIAHWIDKGKTVVMTTQVIMEGSDMSVYRVGKKMKERYHLMESYDMIPEAVITKIMWALSEADKPEDIRRLMYTTINHDILLTPEHKPV